MKGWNWSAAKSFRAEQAWVRTLPACYASSSGRIQGDGAQKAARWKRAYPGDIETPFTFPPVRVAISGSEFSILQ